MKRENEMRARFLRRLNAVALNKKHRLISSNELSLCFVDRAESNLFFFLNIRPFRFYRCHIFVVILLLSLKLYEYN